MKTGTDEGTIKAGTKKFTAGKQTLEFEVPNDITYKYTWSELEESDVVVESEHVKVDEVISAVNTVRKNNARQNSYMNALAPYKPDTMTPEQRVELAIRNLVQSGVPEALARQTIETMKASL